MASFNWPINPTTFNAGPIEFQVDGIDTIVGIDTVTPSNSTPLPVQQLNLDGTKNDPLKKQVAFIRNGTEVVVTEDTVTPGNNLPLPVKLTSVTGDINITAGDLNVQLSDQGANPDVTRIGDGTTQLGITLSNEAKVSDATAQASLANIEAVDFATETTLASILADTASLDGKDFATETTLAAVSAQIPATLGQKAMANSLAVVLSSDQSPLNVRSGLVPTEYDEIVLTYVGVGLDGEGQVATATYKLATVTVATLTLSYDANDKLVGVVRT